MSGKYENLGEQLWQLTLKSSRARETARKEEAKEIGGMWPNFVCDVAVPCGFARPQWTARLRESMPLGRKMCWHKFGVSPGSGMVDGVHDAWCYMVVCGTRCGDVT